MKLVLALLLNTLALYITDQLLFGLTISDAKTTFLAAIVLGLLNTFIKPILMFLSAPLNFVTLGLFTFVVNAVILSMTAWVLKERFILDNFGWAILAAGVLSVISTALSMLLSDLSRKGRGRKHK